LKIYIYGNQSFKKEIHNTLEHSNIKFKLDNNVVIEEINNVTKLKEIIENNPKDIYLIDDGKIIKKNSLNKKFKFLAPKDGIEEEFLLQSGIGDLAIDSLKELPKYIIRRYEELKSQEAKEDIVEKKVDDIEKTTIELDDELSMLLSKGDNNNNDNLIQYEDNNDIFDLDKDINLDDIEGLPDNINNENSSDSFETIENFNDDFGLNNISFDYDDDDIVEKDDNDESLDDILENSNNIFEDLDFLGEEITKEDDLLDSFDFSKENEEFEKNEEINIEKIDEDLFKEFDFSNDNIEVIKKVEEKIDRSLQGDKMNDEFFELDFLNEKDLIEALNYKVENNNSKSEYSQVISGTKNETINVDSSNVNDLSLLLSRLLNNKTLEITIKIKD